MVNHVLTDKEMELVLELLQDESIRLMRETRRTSLRAAKSKLQTRQRTVDRLVERFEEMKAGVLSK